MAKIGDRVRFLHSVGGGIIRRIEGNVAYVDDDGFEIPTLLKECVVVAPAAETVERISASPEKVEIVGGDASKNDDPDPFQETPEGENLNVVLAWQAADSRHLSSTSFDTYLVNDSNYYLYVVYASRADDSPLWNTRYAGVIEPGMQIFVDALSPADLPDLDRINIRLLPFKTNRPWKMKNPVAVDMPLDTSKFFKLHCYKDNPYFDDPVIAIDIVKDDRPHVRSVIDSSRLEEGLAKKLASDQRPSAATAKKSQPSRATLHRRGDTIEVDLHIDALVDTTVGLSNADMINLQIDKFREVMDANLKNHGQKIIFIHGKGEGVLRQAILKELSHRYKGHRVQDASFKEYGFGATQVII